MTLYDAGELSVTPQKYNDLTVTASEPSDVFKFELAEEQNINLLLTDIRGSNAKIKLYRDDGDGRYDVGDEFLIQSDNPGQRDEFINYRAEAGTYFVRVVRNEESPSTSIRYDFLMSATPLSPYPPDVESPPNLLAREKDLGNLDRDRGIAGSISDENVMDTYAFSLGAGEGVNLYLRGLEADADIRIVRDANFNRIADADETIAYSAAGGNANEQILGFEQPGEYFVQVYQYSGETPYRLRFDHYAMPT